MIVLDTNVVSELMRQSPAAAVVRWLGSRPDSSYYVTSITQAEILRGIQLLPQGKRREALAAAARTTFESEFRGRVLAFTGDAASVYAVLAAERQRNGRPISIFDAQIASIARVHGASIGSRNVEDFAGCGVEVVDPWG